MQFLAGVVTSIHTDAEEAQCGPEQEATDDQRGDEPRRVDQRRRDRRRIRLLACNHQPNNTPTATEQPGCTECVPEPATTAD